MYHTEERKTRIDVLVEDETVWLTQMSMAELFQTTVPNNNMYIKKILKEGELDADSTIKGYLQVRNKGPGRIKRNVKHFNLEMIINVFLQFNKREVLEHPGKVSAEVAKRLALDEYDKFNTRRLAQEAEQPDSDFERIIKQIEWKKAGSFI